MIVNYWNFWMTMYLNSPWKEVEEISRNILSPNFNFWTLIVPYCFLFFFEIISKFLQIKFIFIVCHNTKWNENAGTAREPKSNRVSISRDIHVTLFALFGCAVRPFPLSYDIFLSLVERKGGSPLFKTLHHKH